MILTPDDLAQLTNRTRACAQRRELDHLGIPYKVRRDGTLLVLWSEVAETKGRTMPEREPELHL